MESYLLYPGCLEESMYLRDGLLGQKHVSKASIKDHAQNLNKERLHVRGIVLVKGTYKTFSMPFPNTLDPEFDHTLISFLTEIYVLEPSKRVPLTTPSMKGAYKTFRMSFPNTLDPEFEHTLTSFLTSRYVYEPPKRVPLTATSMKGAYRTFSMSFPNTLDPNYEHTLTSFLTK